MQAATQQEAMTFLDIEEQAAAPLAVVQQPRAAAVATPAANQPTFSKSESFLLALLDRGATPEQIERAMDLRDRQDAKVAEQLFNAANAAFKAEAIEIIKTKRVQFRNKAGGMTDYTHAELSDLIEAVTPRLSAHGLSISWKPTKQTRDWIEVTCTLKHAGGHSETATLGADPDASGGKNSIQAIGSAMTYLERYTAKAILGIAEKGQDNDGRGETPDGEAPPTDARAAAASETYPAADFDRNLPTWKKYIESGRKTADDIVQTVKAKKPFSAEQEKQIRAIHRAQ